MRVWGSRRWRLLRGPQSAAPGAGLADKISKAPGRPAERWEQPAWTGGSEITLPAGCSGDAGHQPREWRGPRRAMAARYSVHREHLSRARGEYGSGDSTRSTPSGFVEGDARRERRHDPGTRAGLSR